MDVKYLKYLCVWFVGHIRVKSWKKLICIHSKSGNVHVQVWIEDTELYPSFNGRPCVTPQFCTIGLNGGPWAMPQFCTIVQNVSLPNHIIFCRKWSFILQQAHCTYNYEAERKKFSSKMFQVRLTLPVAPKIQLNFGKVKIPESNLLFCSWFKKADCYLGLRYFILCMNK